MISKLSSQELYSLKESYYKILSHFLSEPKVESRYIVCLLKWGLQLDFTPEELRYVRDNLDNIRIKIPLDKVDRMEAIYHLVNMIYLDDVMEDVELEVASIYAQDLGFKPSVVGELLKSISTAPFDERSNASVRDEVVEFLKLNDVE